MLSISCVISLWHSLGHPIIILQNVKSVLALICFLKYDAFLKLLSVLLSHDFDMTKYPVSDWPWFE